MKNRHMDIILLQLWPESLKWECANINTSARFSSWQTALAQDESIYRLVLQYDLWLLLTAHCCGTSGHIFICTTRQLLCLWAPTTHILLARASSLPGLQLPQSCFHPERYNSSNMNTDCHFIQRLTVYLCPCWSNSTLLSPSLSTLSTFSALCV